ncbi:MAG TPA: glycoside hydrolase family 3 N-terminal domain-containing protein [Planctomycetota bacterium]|nr:glycoside hydrolase family 3 N-terminal domain-containing protein [Planctomycetota bacterium]
MTDRLAEVYGIEATPVLLEGLREGRPTGVHLLRRNIESPEQVRQLSAAIRTQMGAGFDVAVRHEGGAVTPFVRGVTPFPGLEALEAASNAVLARDVGRAMGLELAAMGITLNLVSGSGPMAAELAVGLRSSGIKTGPEPVVPGPSRAQEPGEGAALASAVAEASLRLVRDPRKLFPIPPGRRVGLLIPRLGDVADRIPMEDALRGTASLIRPRVGASVAVLEIPVQPDERSVALAADWMETQEIAVFFCFQARRFAGQKRLLDAVAARCPRRLIVTIGDSTDQELAGGDASILRTCGFQGCQLTAALRAIFPPLSSGGKRK